ncbi:hypothetical protein NE237_009162 [Protea cynaroides]|uniref:Uncharacterized protein n=1 Tax=Protea cynaroides TaxID=273540 RepID=A0A9Q0KWZ1_9MAGN|nr:hypothetical protein NE237_009162 [Protea cynaroides]
MRYPPVFWFPLGLPCSQVDPMAARKGDLVLYSGDLFPIEAGKLPSCPRSHSVNQKGKPTHPSAPLVDASLDLSIVFVLKAPSGLPHCHNSYSWQGLEASYQRLSARTSLGLVSSARPFCLARLPARSEEFMGRQAGPTGTVEEVPRRATATSLTPFMQL